MLARRRRQPTLRSFVTCQHPSPGCRHDRHQKVAMTPTFIPVASFYSSPKPVTAVPEEKRKSCDIERDLRFIRNLKKANVKVRRLVFIQNSRFLVRRIFRKKPYIRVQRLRISTTESESKSRSKNITGKVTYFEDEQISFLKDLPIKNVKIIRLNSSLTYVKPSQSEENYGLGGKLDMEKDDVDNPRKAIPLWAQDKSLKKALKSQITIDTDMIFSSCDSLDSDLTSMFPGSGSRILCSYTSPSPAHKMKSKKPKPLPPAPAAARASIVSNASNAKSSKVSRNLMSALCCLHLTLSELCVTCRLNVQC